VTVAVVGTVVAIGASNAAAGTEPVPDGPGYRVAHYDVNLDYDPAKPDFLTGDTTVTARSGRDLDRISFDLEGFDVRSVTVDAVPVKAFDRGDGKHLVVTPRRPVAAGTRFAVRVRYAGTPGFWWMTASDQGAVHAYGEPHSAPSWYPVDDRPSDKATFHTSTTVPDTGWTVVGNGTPEPPVTRAGRKTFRWSEARPVASYLTGLVIDKLTVYTSTLADGTKVIDAYAPGAEGSKPQEDRLPEVMSFLTATLGPYPFPTIGGIFYPGDSGGGFEVQQRPAYPAGIQPKDFTTIVHEVAHQWFGNSVTVADWRDICLKECFAAYTERLWSEAKEGHHLDAEYRATVEAHRADPDYWKFPLADPGDALYGGSYTVGPLMLHALRRTVGDQAFFAILRDWLSRHRYGNASWAEFETFAAHRSARELSGFFRAWAHSTTVPTDEYLYPKGLPR
jgi:aminopeptidase N